MTVPAPPDRHHSGSPPPDSLLAYDNVFTGATGDDSGPLPPHLRPAPRPENFPRGVWARRQEDQRFATRGLVRSQREELAAADRVLAARLDEQGNQTAALAGRIAELEALSAALGNLAAALAGRVDELEAKLADLVAVVRAIDARDTEREAKLVDWVAVVRELVDRVTEGEPRTAATSCRPASRGAARE